ncbi:MAG: NAD(P)H-dependent oxidoreductase [Cyanothece sp. SIO1E1]|nr:NAD(P)H-dependent oxidoreductase [Cyanothece sp. SIO1E1]
MLKILAFGASNSRNSINKQLAAYAAAQFAEAAITLIDLNDFEMPLFGVDREREEGIPSLAHDFKALIEAHDLLVISMAEHNGSYSVAFKNLLDWTSRIEQKLWTGRPMFMLSTSPGKRGGASVLETASVRAGFMGGEVVATFSLPSFRHNFSAEEGISDPELAASFQQALEKVKAHLAT